MSVSRRRSVALLLVAVLAVTLIPAVGVAIDNPRLFAFAPSPILEPGERTELRVQLLNDDEGDEVADARNVRATLESGDSPVVVRSATVVAGDIPSGDVVEVTFDVRVPADAPPGEYDLPIELEFVADDEVITRTRRVTVRIPETPRFEVVETETDANVGDRGDLSVVLRNAGAAPARDATVTLTSEDPALTFAGGPVAEAYLGRVGPGEEARVDVSMAVTEAASVRPYAIDATVDYEDPDGERRSRTLPVSVTPRDAPSFAVVSVEADLRVGDRGTVLVTVENTGGTVARDATVALSAPWINRTAALEYPVGDLEPGASAEARFGVDLPAGVDPGPRRLDLRVAHAGASGERRTGDPLGERVEVGPRRSPVGVEPLNATFEVDTDGRLDVRLTNRGDGAVTDLRATLTPTEPLSSDDPSAFVPRLAAGESTTVAFHLDVSDDAVVGEHPISVSFAYDDANGNPRSVEDVPFGVTVVEQPGSGFPIAATVVVVVALAAGAFWWYRRR